MFDRNLIKIIKKFNNVKTKNLGENRGKDAISCIVTTNPFDFN